MSAYFFKMRKRIWLIYARTCIEFAHILLHLLFRLHPSWARLVFLFILLTPLSFFFLPLLLQKVLETNRELKSKVGRLLQGNSLEEEEEEEEEPQKSVVEGGGAGAGKGRRGGGSISLKEEIGNEMKEEEDKKKKMEKDQNRIAAAAAGTAAKDGTETKEEHKKEV